MHAGEKSTFPWTYGEAETCYILQGKVTVTPTLSGSTPVTVRVFFDPVPFARALPLACRRLMMIRPFRTLLWLRSMLGYAN